MQALPLSMKHYTQAYSHLYRRSFFVATSAAAPNCRMPPGDNHHWTSHPNIIPIASGNFMRFSLRAKPASGNFFRKQSIPFKTIGITCSLLLLTTSVSSAQDIDPPPRPTQQQPQPETATADQFPESVSAIFQQNCWKCHSGEMKAAGLNLQTLQQLSAGGDSGAVVHPGSADQSLLLRQLFADAEVHMPPSGQLSDQDIETIRNWIDNLPAETWEPPAAIDTTTAQTPLSFPEDLPISLAIDFFIHRGYSNESQQQATLCSDQTFIRRLYLDLAGRIPTPQEQAQFAAQTDSRKRQTLIDQLLGTDRYAKTMAITFDTMLMGRNERKRGQRKDWLQFLETSFRDNKPWNLLAQEVLLARPIDQQQGHLWYLFERENNHQEIAESIAKGFFGIDIACAQCHDHPLAGEIKQAHYWGLVAFYKRTQNQRQEGRIRLAESAIGGFDNYANALKGTTDASKLTFLGADTIFEPRPEDPAKQEDKEEFYVSTNGQRLPKFSRREKFVQEIVTDHPLLARAMVNRIWGLMMGRGLIHPIEKMDSNHPASHPELLDWLARDFESHHYDVKRLIRGIVSSQTYQLAAKRPADIQVEDAQFAFGLTRPVPAESLLNSLSIALDIPVPADSPAAQQWRKRFPEIVPELSQTDLKQALLVSNYPDLNQLIRQAAEKELEQSGTIDTLKIQQLFLRIYGRAPDPTESQAIIQYVNQRQDRPVDAMTDILWALISSAEFQFNH